MHAPDAELPVLPTPVEATAEPHSGTVSSMHAPDAELPVLPMPAEATASISGIPEFGSIGPHLGLAYALQSKSPRLPQPQLPLLQAHGNDAAPEHHITALPQPEANSYPTEEAVEESVEPQILPPPQAACASTAAQSSARAADMPTQQPGSLQQRVQESVTAHPLPTEVPTAAPQGPGSQPATAHSQAPENAPHPAAQNSRLTGAMQTPRPQGASSHAPPHAAEAAPHAGQTGASADASLTPARPQPSPARMNGAHRQAPSGRPPPPGFNAWGRPLRPVNGWSRPTQPANGLRQAGLDSHHLNYHQGQSEKRIEQPESTAAVVVADTYRKQQSAASSQDDEENSSQQSHLAAGDALSSGASSQSEVASGCIDAWQAQGSGQLPKKLAQRAADDDEIPASFCCPITQVSKALGRVLPKHCLAVSCILRAPVLSRCTLPVLRRQVC